MNYLVTGGTGFLGSHICRDLVRQGETVLAHDLIPNTSIMDKITTPEERESITVEQGDVTDFTQLSRAITTHKIDKIIHLATTVHPQSDLNPPLAEKVINGGMINVLECCRIFGIKKLVWASSVGVFGEPKNYPEGDLANDAPHIPQNVYGSCKSHCEFLARHYQRDFGVDHIGLRFTVLYGPGRVRGISTFAQKMMIEPAALGQPAEIIYGDAKMDWQYVDDVAALAVKCSKVGPTKSQIYNTVVDVRTLKEAKEYIESIIPDAKIKLDQETLGQSPGSKIELDDSVLQEEIGFQPKYNMERGILATMNFYRKEAGLPELVDPNMK